MPGTAAGQPRLAGPPPNAAALGGSTGGAAPSSSDVYSSRVSQVIDKLYRQVQGIYKTDRAFLTLCISLARSIDHAIAYGEVLSRYQELPALTKQVCQNTDSAPQQAAAMVLMISVKHACQSGWFSNEDSEQLNNLAKEIVKRFASASNFTTAPCDSHSDISTIMSRFYPRMKMGQIFAFLGIKPGFNACVTDFLLSKNVKLSRGEKIRLFVAQMDNNETSSCLVSPANVNFLVNGKGVARRTNVSVDMGPQIPTAINNLLKYGTNLLQVVGDFSGHYIVAVAIMSQMPNPDSSALQDYVQLPTTTVDSGVDPEIIEGQSRISLCCPISHQRIKTPVKGRACKHIQCFDFDNYVEINSRKPTWRCPCCNQHVCFTDIRIDQKMVKVLQEVGLDASCIIFSSDGSWNAVMGSNDSAGKPQVDNTSMGNKPAQPPDVLDLTQTDDAMDALYTCGTEDMKNVNRCQFMSRTASINPPVNAQVEPNAQVVSVSNPASVPANAFTSPPAEIEASDGNLFTVMQNETSLPNMQQHPFGNPSARNEFGRLPSMIPRHVTQTPPVPARNSGTQQSPRSSASNFIPSSVSAASQVPLAAPNIPAAFPVQTSSPFVQQVRNNFPVSTAAPSIPTTLGAQSSTTMLQPSFRNGENTSNPNGISAASQPSLAAQNITPNWRANPSHVSQASVPSLHQEQNEQPNPSRLLLVEAANRAAHMASDAPRAYPSFLRNVSASNAPFHGDPRVNIGTASQPAAATGTDTNDPNNINWRPAGRMRGALTGQAYTEALNQFIIQPSQQAQAVPTNIPPQLQASMSSRASQGGATAHNYPHAGPAHASNRFPGSGGMR